MTKAVKARRARRSEGQWRALLARHQTSGLGIKAFCRGERISEASFYRWRTMLQGDRGDGAGAGTKSAFVDLGALGSVADRPRFDLKLDLGDGLILHLVRH
jgi:hypothetical protein